MNLKNLEAILFKAKQAYYFSGTPIMSDAEYDALEDKLKQLSPDSPILKLTGAPVPDTYQGKRATHNLFMGSQDKVHSFEELKKWVENKQCKQYHASYKGDGGSIALYYVSGVLQTAITRGDGFIGEDITASAVCFKGVPSTLQQPFNLSVRCEAVLTLDDWDIMDPQREFKNPRNAVNGILGRLSGKGTAYVTALAFDIEREGFAFSSEAEKTEYLLELGFQTPEYTIGDIETIRAFQESANEMRQKNALPYWIDGIVVKLNDIEEQLELGLSTSNKPRGQVAWKFEPEGATTKVLSIIDQVGHSGAVTPVAQIEPVEIGGTTVSNVSLANYEVIKNLGLTLNAEVIVVKAGDIIPQITKVIQPDPTKPIEPPTVCPSCGQPLTYKKNVDGSDTVVLYCENPDCPAQNVGKIRRWAESRDILGLGTSVIQALVDAGKIATVADLYRTTPSDIEDVTLSGEKVKLGNKRATTICSEIQSKATKMPLHEFLGSFGTRSLGVRRAKLMIEANSELVDIDKWFDGSLLDSKFAAQSGMPQAAKVIYEGLKMQESIIYDALKYVEIEQSKKQLGQSLCITGSLPSGKKKNEYEKPLADKGIELVGDVKKGLNFLVVSDPSKETSKTIKAKKLGIQIIDELGLQALIE